MIKIVRDRLEYTNADIVCYGAKDTGEMGGGAASSILKFAGPQILTELKTELAKSSLQVGEVVVTDSFGMKKQNVKWICHIISIIKNTPEGAYCPHPEKIIDGVTKSLAIARLLKAKSIAFSALATGEGRVTSQKCAQFMLQAARSFANTNKKQPIEIIFALPSYPDYIAFQNILSSL